MNYLPNFVTDRPATTQAVSDPMRPTVTFQRELRRHGFFGRLRLHYRVFKSYMPTRWIALKNAWRLARR